MKKFNLSIMMAIAVIVVLSGCNGLNKMKKSASGIKYEVKPDVLEMHGGNVGLSVVATYPVKFFNKKAVVVATPVLKTPAGDVEFKPLTLQGEKVTDNNKVINFASGGKATFEGTIPYTKDMRQSELIMKVEASMKLKKVAFEPVKIADGVISTPVLLANQLGEVVVAPDKFQRIVPETYKAEIKYDINRAEVKKTEMKSEAVTALKDKVKTANSKSNYNIKGVDVSAFASPDGKLELNDKLAKERSQTASKFFKKELETMKVSKADQSEFFKLMSTAEDWDGFKDLVTKSKIQDKDLILRVLSMYNDPDVREKEIRNISVAFTELADQILPALRRSKFSVNVDVVGKSDEELLKIATSKPSDLEIEEVLYAATLTKDVKVQNGIYKAATEKFPTCYRAWNDYGMTAAQQGDMKTAKTAAAGSQAEHNMGIVNVKKGDYKQAVTNFGSSCLFNAALAQTLNKDYAKALKTLDCITEPNGITSYLKAIVYARQGQSANMFKSLEAAVAAQSDLKQMAKTDLEFGKFFEDAKFQGIVK
ncbi:MAG: hypothetical protein NTV01_18450 [Bacteroidia bacterium]|nr:hypothetical protein [Bacteroidia bacterium]